jgi:hypothetical protein
MAAKTQATLPGFAKRRAPATASVSALHRKTGLSRATIVERLEAAKVKPKIEKPTAKLYDLEAATSVLTTGDNGRGAVSGLNEARRKKTIAEAARITLKLQRERGDLVAMHEIREHLFQFVKAMYVRIAKRYPRENARRLRKCRSEADLAHTIEVDLALIFDELKRDYPQIF